MNAQNTLLFLIIITIRCEEDLKVRIGVPEYICDKDGGIRDVSKDLTTIRLLGKDAKNLTYKFDVNFLTIGKQCAKEKNQRCTLLKWKTVRELDHFLKTYPPSKLEAGLIEINNTMFNPGLKYIINVTLMDKGRIMEEKQLTLDYVDDSVRSKVKKPMASLLLLAPDTSYAYATYVINAEVNICSNISSYYFNWDLIDAENTTYFPSRSAELAIPPDTLKATQTYTIQCTLVSISDGATLAESQQSVNVLSKGLLLRLPFKRITTRTGQDIHIKPYIRDLDNVDGEVRTSWSCLDMTTNQECDYDATHELEGTAFTAGTYKISLEISKSDFTQTDSCIVEVSDNAPVVEIEEIDHPINPSRGVEIQATIYELRTSCTLEWTSLKEEGYESLDLITVPGNIADVVNVTMKEDLFLDELEEYANGTTEKRHDLIIPPFSEDWDGLKGDAQYLFRLVVTCPIMGDVNATETTITDVIIETNAPPMIEKLNVTPLEGDAFVTTFRFTTLKAVDKDEPILYKFGFFLNDRDVILWNLGDVTNCETTLPYSDDGIQTFVEACDTFNSCGRTLGPLIKTKISDKVDKELILQRFVSKLTGGDYTKAFIEAFTISWSYQAQDDDKVKRLISEKVTNEIDNYLHMDERDYRLKNNANELLRIINEFNSDLDLPETVINKVLELRNKLSDESENYTQRKLLSIRTRRASSLSLYDVRSYLEISELIITTSNDVSKVNQEKENLRKQLRYYMEKLCSNMKKTQLSLELKTVIFSVEKLKKNSQNNFISIPFESNSWQVFGRIKLGGAVKDSKEKCVGKAIFRDYFDKVGITYFTDILNSSDINESAEIVLFLPKNKSMEGIPKCVVYYNNRWRSECKVVQNIANYVKCSCKHLGYYYLDYTQVTSSVPTMTPTVQVTETTLIPTVETNITNSTTTNTTETLTQLKEEGSKASYDTVSYVVIAVSVIGIIVLGVIVRQIFHDDDENEESDTFEFPKYAQLQNEEFLNDAHI